METILYNIKTSLLFFVMTASLPAFASDGDFRKEKSISKVYLVNADAGVDISNRYGSVYVTTWDENKIGIDVVIKVNGKNENAVTKRINSITIEINPLVNLVTAKTVLEELSGNNNISIEINYTVKIPRDGSVKINNKYGAIITDKIQGKADIQCKYGSIELGELLSADNTINIQYCDNSTINYIRSGTIDAKYSGLKIVKSGNLTYSSSYTNLNLKEVTNISYKSNYGDLTIGNANNVEGNGDYLTLKFGNLNNNFNINTRYSSIVISNITAKANNIAVSSAYTNIDFKYDANYSFNFDFNFKFSNLSASGLNFQTKKETNTTSSYSGYYKNSGSNKITVNSNYGNLKLTKI